MHFYVLQFPKTLFYFDCKRLRIEKKMLHFKILLLQFFFFLKTDDIITNYIRLAFLLFYLSEWDTIRM